MILSQSSLFLGANAFKFETFQVGFHKVHVHVFAMHYGAIIATHLPSRRNRKSVRKLH